MTPQEKEATKVLDDQRKFIALQKRNALRAAKLSPRQSSFGWVFFDNPPLNKQPEIPTTLDKPLDVAQQALATETEEQQAAPPAQPVTQSAQQSIELKEIQKDVQKIEEAQKITASAQTSPESSNSTKSPTKLPDSNSNSNGMIPVNTSSLEDNKRAQEIHEAQEKRDKLITMLENGTLTAGQPDTGTSTGTHTDVRENNNNHTAGTEQHGTTFVRGAHRDKPAQKRNLIALTKGFVENLKNEGSDIIERDGDASIRPSLDELRYINYEAKINWYLQASWKQNFERNSLYRTLEGHAAIEFTLNENGNVITSQLIKSTGHPELDSMIMKNLQFAQPFPPLPKHFGTTRYTTSRSIHVSAEKIKL